jgi:hypothetical protein
VGHIKSPIFKFDLKMKSRARNTVSDETKLVAGWDRLTAGNCRAGLPSIGD